MDAPSVFRCRVAVAARCAALAFSVAALISAPARATTIRVPSERPTIQAGIDVAAEGDTVLVAPGVFEEHLTITASSLTLVSEDPSGTFVRSNEAVIAVTGASFAMTGFVVEMTVVAQARSALAVSGPGFVVDSCTFHGGVPSVTIGGDGTLRQCTVSGGQGGLGVRNGADVTLEDCYIHSNTTATFGGGIAILPYPYESTTVTLSRCRLQNNEAAIGGGAIALEAAFGQVTQVTIDECLLLDNTSRLGAAIYSLDGDVVLRASTIAGNGIIEGTTTGGIIDFDDAVPTPSLVSHCIVAFNDGPAMGCFGSASPQIACSDVFGNTDDRLCGDDRGSNISLDPLFCGRDAGDFTLQLSSPCAPEHAPTGCGLIGALPAACVDPVLETTWGVVKSWYAPIAANNDRSSMSPDVRSDAGGRPKSR